MGKLIIFIGGSGSGKSALAQYLIENNEAEKIVSTTSRNPRIGEINGKHYNFEDLDVIETMIKEDKFLEYSIYSGNYYGITKDEIEKRMSNSDLVVHVMEIKGALKVKKTFPNTILIYCDAPIDILMERMYERGDDFKSITKRVKTYVEEKEYDNIKYADFVINNTGSIEDSYKQLDTILEQC